MYTEKQLQEAIQTCILTLDTYEGGDVVINDWTIFDQQVAFSPYVIIGNCSIPEIDYRNDTHKWTIPLVVAVAFGKTWEITENQVRDYRQEIITLFRTDPYQQLGLSAADEGLELQSFTPHTGVLPWYDPHISNEQLQIRTTIPLFLYQEWGLVIWNY